MSIRTVQDFFGMGVQSWKGVHRSNKEGRRNLEAREKTWCVGGIKEGNQEPGPEVRKGLAKIRPLKNRLGRE